MIGYIVCGAVLVGAGAGVVASLVVPGAAAAVWWGAALAFGAQVVAFAALVAVRQKGVAFFAAMGGGVLLRLALVLIAGLWLARSGVFPPAPLLLSLAGFLFVLLLLEPVFFRIGWRGR